jgi:hypothetical protein
VRAPPARRQKRQVLTDRKGGAASAAVSVQGRSARRTGFIGAVLRLGMDPDDRGPLRHHISMSLRGSPPDHNVSGRTIVVHRGPDSWRPGRCNFESRRVHLCRFMTGVCHWRLVDLVVDDHVWYRFESPKKHDRHDSPCRPGYACVTCSLRRLSDLCPRAEPFPFVSFEFVCRDKSRTRVVFSSGR